VRIGRMSMACSVAERGVVGRFWGDNGSAFFLFLAFRRRFGDG
jgi:hypothetical protein